MMVVVDVGYRRRKRCRIWQTQVQIVHGEGVEDNDGKRCRRWQAQIVNVEDVKDSESKNVKYSTRRCHRRQ